MLDVPGTARQRDAATGALGAMIAAIGAMIVSGLTCRVGMAGMIRDNPLLNNIMLIHPDGAIKSWQAAGG